MRIGPPYRVPSMAEIAEIPWNGYQVVSTFSGAGGSCLGYRMAGFRVVWASEFVPAARETYRANHPGAIVDDRDIRQVRGAEILAAIGRDVGEIDLLDGSPPCASFSTAGKRSRDWGRVKPYSDTKQRTDDLFFEYARLLGEIRPRTFVAENVSGLVKGVAKGCFLEILAALKAQGYRVSARLLDAQWLGVPQARQRLIFVGVREDLGLDPAFPKPLPHRYSVRDAVPWICSVVHDTSGDRSIGEVVDRPCPTITVGGQQVNACHFKVEAKAGDSPIALDPGPACGWKAPSRFDRVITPDDVAPTVMVHGRSQSAIVVEIPKVEPETDISRYAIGAEWDRMRPGEQSDRYFNLQRPDPDRPCPTVTAPAGMTSAATVVHPTEKRRFSIAELKRICAFPDDFVLTGSYAQQWERLGRAVPPLMMRAVAETIRDRVLIPARAAACAG